MQRRVFISSTCYDLLDLRAELKEFLKSRNLVPVMSDQLDSEFVSLQDTNSIETCLVNLNTCDIVIVILSQRYGPTLEGAGFEPLSATHLEYNEAVRKHKRLFLFVRDRLEADYATYRKSKDPKLLSWIRDKDVPIFSIIESHKRLTTDPVNNWYWTFGTSFDIKKKLEVELQTQILEYRLDELIRNGDVPFITISATAGYLSNRKHLKVVIRAENLGTQTAIEPMIVIYETGQANMEQSDENARVEICRKPINSIRAGEKSELFECEFAVDHFQSKAEGLSLIVDVVYINAFGDGLSDSSLLKVTYNQDDPHVLDLVKSFVAKQYRGKDFYNRLVSGS